MRMFFFQIIWSFLNIPVVDVNHMFTDYTLLIIAVENDFKPIVKLLLQVPTIDVNLQSKTELIETDGDRSCNHIAQYSTWFFFIGRGDFFQEKN